MRKLLTIFLLLSAAQGYGATFAPDTVDNWQIYHGGKLLTAGMLLSAGNGTLKQKDVKDLEIVYNHCSPYANLAVTIEITDERDRPILIRHFRINSGDRMKISSKALSSLPTGPLRIRYREQAPNGVDVLLALITIT